MTPKNRLSRNQNISLPDMAPFAGLIFLIAGFFMLTGRFKQPGETYETGVVKLEQLPASPFTCYKPLDPNGAGGCVISLNKKSQLSFALPEVGEHFQALVINQVAAQHGVLLSAAQQEELKGVPFLACDVEQLPLLLSFPARQRMRLTLSGRLGNLSASQLAECVAATKTLAPNKVRQQVFFYLKVESDVLAPQLRALTDLLQAQGINRFNLLTRGRD